MIRNVQLKSRAKNVESNPFAVSKETLIRKNINECPEKFQFMFNDIEVVDSKELKGLKVYEADRCCMDNFVDHLDNDENENHCRAIIYGTDPHGNSVAVQIMDAVTTIYIEVPDNWGPHQFDLLMKTLKSKLKLKQPLEYTVEKRMRSYGWVIDADYYQKFKKKRTKRYTVLYTKFPSIETMKRAVNIMKSKKYPFIVNDIGDCSDFISIHESTIDISTRFIELMKLDPCGWISVNNWYIPDLYLTHAQIEVCTTMNCIELNKESSNIAPLTMLSWDIEQMDKSDKFPNSFNIYDCVICINSRVCTIENNIITSTRSFCHAFNQNLSNNQLNEHGFFYRKHNDIHVFEYNEEIKMILGWRDFYVTTVNPDISVAYNQRNFDWSKLVYRVILSNAIEKTLNNVDNTDELDYYIQQIKIRDSEMYQKICLKKHVYGKLKVVLESIYDKQVLGIDPTRKKFNNNTYIPFWINFGFDKIERKGFHDPSSSRFFMFSNRISQYTPYKVKMMSNAALGDNNYKMIVPHGRLGDLDLYLHMKSVKKLDSYGLGDVAKSLLGMEKIDLKAHVMFDLFRKGEYTKIWEYADRDVELPALLMQKDNIILAHVEMARVSSTRCVELLTRGTQIKSFNSIIRKGHMLGFYINLPTKEKVIRNNDGYEGAQVMDPVYGYQDMYIVICDVESLYPSKQKHYFLCPSTWIEESRYRDLFPSDDPQIKDFNTGMGKWSFIQADGEDVVCICSTLVHENKTYRSKIKEEMKEINDKDPRKSILGQRELALKLLMNGRYGFFGVTEGLMPCLPVADAITAAGRDTILEAKAKLEEHYGERIIVLGGDTDSLFLGIPKIPIRDDETLKQAFEFGQEICEFITNLDSTGNTKFQLEGIARRGIFLKKKKYVIYSFPKYNDPKNPPKIIAKGIEMKRRDNTKTIRNLQTTLCNTILVDQRKDDAPNYVIDLMEKMKDDKIPLDMYIITKSFKSNYSKAKSKPIHVHVRDLKEKRAKGSGEKSGDRIKYVLKQVPLSEHKYLRGEDPEYLKEHPKECKIDRLEYLEQFVKPTCDILETIYQNPHKLFEYYRATIFQQQKGIKSVDSILENNLILQPVSTQEQKSHGLQVMSKENAKIFAQQKSNHENRKIPIKRIRVFDGDEGAPKKTPKKKKKKDAIKANTLCKKANSFFE